MGLLVDNSTFYYGNLDIGKIKTATEQKTIKIRGIIIDPDNKPAANAKVCLFVKRNFFDKQCVSQFITDQEGYYECTYEWSPRLFDATTFHFSVKITHQRRTFRKRFDKTPALQPKIDSFVKTIKLRTGCPIPTFGN